MTAPRSTESDPDGQSSVRRGVIGLGNPLRGDDGVVPELFERLRTSDREFDAEFLEFGDANFRMLHALADFDRVLVVDAVRYGGEPGEHVEFTPEEVVSKTDSGGSHDSDLLELVELADRMGESADEVRIFGIQPASMEMGDGLSDPMEARLTELVAALEDSVKKL